MEKKPTAGQPRKSETSKAARFDHWVRHSPPVLILALTLFLIVTVGGTVHYGRDVYHWYRRTYDWRSTEYARLGRLHSDFTFAGFEDVLGPPLFQDVSRDRHWTQYLFRGRGYWVQALTRRGRNTVEAYAITACDKSFQPTFHAFRRTITLNRSRLSDYHGDPFTRFTYIIPADIGPLFYVVSGGARVNNFQSFAWGADGACWSLDPTGRSYITLTPPKGHNDFEGHMRLRAVPKTFSRRLVINTFAEWGPTLYTWPKSLPHIGIDDFYLNALQTSAP